mgnify:FL=1
MEDYKKLYTLLFNAITDALEQLAEGRVPQAQEMLTTAQQDAEELFLSAGE